MQLNLIDIRKIGEIYLKDYIHTVTAAKNQRLKLLTFK